MTKPIINEISLQIYGDGDLQEEALATLANHFKADVVIRQEKPYETKYGRSGTYRNVLIQVDR